MRPLLAAALSFGIAETLSLSASAYTFRSTSAGHPTRWPTEAIRLVVDPSIPRMGADARGAVASALAAWDGVPSASGPKVDLVDGEADEIGYRPGQANQNTLRYAPNGLEIAGPALGVTVVTFDAEGTVVDADIVLNGGGPRSFGFLEDQREHGRPSDASTDKRYDVQNVLAHEVGHFFGLGENTTDEDATMFVTSARSETKKRDLDADDEEGLRALYPVTTPSEAEAVGCALASRSGGAPRGWFGIFVTTAGLLGALALRPSRRRRALLGGATLAMAGLFGPPPTSTPHDDPAVASEDADAIGEIVASTSRWSGGLVITRLTIAPSCLSTACSSDRIDVEAYGGTAGGLTQIVGHDAVPAVGKQISLRWQNGAVVLPARFPLVTR